MGLLLALLVGTGTGAAAQSPVTYGEFISEGKQAFTRKDFKAAEQHFTKAIALRPESIEAYLFRADSWLAMGKHGQAIKDYTQILKLDPNQAIAYYNRGATYLGKEYDYKKALKDFDATIVLAPKYVDAYINRSLCYMGLKRFEEAHKDLDTALKITPDNPAVYRALAVVTRVEGKIEIAQAYELKAAMLERQQK